MKKILFYALLMSALLLTACKQEFSLAPNWQSETLAEWDNPYADMMVLSDNQSHLYVNFENKGKETRPFFGVLDLESKQHRYVAKGLQRADGLKKGPQGSLWLGEEIYQGRLWRIKDLDALLAHQNPSTALPEVMQEEKAAGRLSHEGLAFANDGRYLYRADEWEKGSLYRYELASKSLMVLGKDHHWKPIKPQELRQQAKQQQAQTWQRIEDMETLKDGSLLMAETTTGRILRLVDHGDTATVSLFLNVSKSIPHPDNLAWDAQRQGLWITDDSSPSRLWLWQHEHGLQEIAKSQDELTGIILDKAGNVYINIQRRKGHSHTLRLTQQTP